MIDEVCIYKTVHHALDTDIDAYNKVMDEVIIPDCMEFAADVRGYPQRIKQFIKNAHPAYDVCLNFAPELLYKVYTPKELQNAEKLRNVQILRALADVTVCMTATLDDVGDNAAYRMHKPAWHKICEGGSFAAVYDASVYGYLTFYVLKKHFRSHPGYQLLVEKFAEVSAQTLIGQVYDLIGTNKAPCYEDYYAVTVYKSNHINTFPAIIGMLNLGIMDEKLIKEVKYIFDQFGVLIRIWDDFLDYFCVTSEKGKESSDIARGVPTWLSITADKHLNLEQKKIFKECYGSTNPDKIEQILKFYDEIDIPRKYIELLRDSYYSLSRDIEKLPDPKLKKFLYSWMDWIFGDAKDINF